MSPHDPTDALLISALAQGASYEQAARHAGVSKATVKRRMADDAFRAHVDGMRSDHVRRVGQRLGELSTQALATIEELLVDRDAPAQRLGASRAVLDGLLRFREAGELEARLAALEARSLTTNGHRAGTWP